MGRISNNIRFEIGFRGARGLCRRSVLLFVPQKVVDHRTCPWWSRNEIIDIPQPMDQSRIK